jgi:hypothetical protein
MKHTFYDGKYTVVYVPGGNFFALRHGKPWRDLTGDGLILAMFQEYDDLKTKYDELLKKKYELPINRQLDISDAARIAGYTYGVDPYNPTIFKENKI